MTEIFDVLIVGGGPAGLTAGLYASRARLKTRMLEKIAPGGQVLTTDWVDNYPGFPEGVAGFELIERMRSQAERFGLDIQSAEAVGLSWSEALIKIDLTEGSMLTKSLILATGSQPVILGIPGERELTGRGVSYCATCDGPFYREAVVGVVGGGDTAVEEALYLTKFASEVHLFHRRDELRATGCLQDRISADPKVKIHWSTVLEAIESDERGLVRGIKYKELKTGKSNSMNLSGVFMFAGMRPNTDFIKSIVELDNHGYVVTDADMATSRPGIFAAGDVRAKLLRQISTAVGDGAIAAFAAEKYINSHFTRNVCS